MQQEMYICASIIPYGIPSIGGSPINASKVLNENSALLHFYHNAGRDRLSSPLYS